LKNFVDRDAVVPGIRGHQVRQEKEANVSFERLHGLLDHFEEYEFSVCHLSCVHDASELPEVGQRLRTLDCPGILTIATIPSSQSIQSKFMPSQDSFHSSQYWGQNVYPHLSNQGW
jgi:hypothetical protein